MGKKHRKGMMEVEVQRVQWSTFIHRNYFKTITCLYAGQNRPERVRKTMQKWIGGGRCRSYRSKGVVTDKTGVKAQ